MGRPRKTLVTIHGPGNAIVFGLKVPLPAWVLKPFNALLSGKAGCRTPLARG